MSDERLWTVEEECARVGGFYRAFKAQYPKRSASRRKDLIKLAAAAERFGRALNQIGEYTTPEQYDLLTLLHRRAFGRSWREDIDTALLVMGTIAVVKAQQPRPRGPERNAPVRWLVRRLRQTYDRHSMSYRGGWQDWVSAQAAEIEPDLEEEILTEIEHLKRSR